MPSKKVARYRRSSALVGYWAGSDFIIENYVIASRTPAPPQLASLLMSISESLSMSRLVKALAPVGYAKVLARFLIKQGIFVRIGSRLDRKENAIDAHWTWDASARHFYFSTSTTRFRTYVAETDDAEWAAREDPPSPFRDRKGPGILLPAFSWQTTDRFFQVLAARRTFRCCAGKEIPLDDFSRILRWTWGATHVMTHPIMRQYVLKTSPSGGSRHPTEVYAAVMRVRGLTPGIYHYSVRHDELTLIKEGFFEDKVVKAGCQGDFLRGSAAVFFMTSIVERSMWKYSVSHALRVLLLDAGHLGQTFHLVCTALSLAPFSFAATDTADIESLLDIDGVREVPIYTCSVGVPADSDIARADRLGSAVDAMGVP